MGEIGSVEEVGADVLIVDQATVEVGEVAAIGEVDLVSGRAVIIQAEGRFNGSKVRGTVKLIMSEGGYARFTTGVLQAQLFLAGLGRPEP